MSDALHPRRLNLKTVRAYHIRLSLQDLWTLRGEEAERFLKAWYYWATHSKLKPVISVAKALREHWDGVLRCFQTRITNGILKGINSLIQAAKAKARGYRSTRNHHCDGIPYRRQARLRTSTHMKQRRTKTSQS
jgi:transposase